MPTGCGGSGRKARRPAGWDTVRRHDAMLGLANAYDLKTLTDCNTNPEIEVSAEDAMAAVETAEQLIAALSTIIESNTP